MDSNAKASDVDIDDDATHGTAAIVVVGTQDSKMSNHVQLADAPMEGKPESRPFSPSPSERVSMSTPTGRRNRTAKMETLNSKQLLQLWG